MIGLVLGVALGGEVVSAGEWWAAGVICAGMVLLVMGRRPHRPSEVRPS